MNVTGNTLRLALFVPLFVSLAFARRDNATCGAYPERAADEILQSRLARERRELNLLLRKISGLATPDSPRPSSRDIGDIALLEADSSLVSRRNLFNLPNRTLRFTPLPAGGYRLDLLPGDYSPADEAASLPVSGLEDDDSRSFPLPFAFPFFSLSHRSLFLNSDGNLSFEQGDNATTERSLGRLLAGAPRIAPFFDDLDPSRGGSVRILSSPSRFVASWAAVPEYSSFGLGPLNTFQIRLFPSGVIEFAFAAMNGEQAVTGLAPGRLAPSPRIVSLIDSSGLSFPAAIAERFTSREELDTVVAAQRFYETHEDSYDYLVFYNALDVSPGPGVVAFEVTVRNGRTGYGDRPVDVGRDYGSPRRLQAVLNMGPLSQYPLDPNAILPQRFTSRDTPLTVLGHEAGHLFLAFASVRDPRNPNALPLLGRQTAHWNFTFNSEASLLEGNRIADRGPSSSQRFETTAVTEGFSPLDQYLMGFRSPEEVPPLFYVADAGINSFFPPPPQVGVRFNGRREDFTIDDLIAEAGRRTPDHTVAQRRFRFGFVLVVPPGLAPDPAAIAQLESYRRLFADFYFRAAGQRATADPTLRKSAHLSLWPASGAILNQPARATLRLAQNVATATNFSLQVRSGALTLPAQITVPAGQREASFDFRGAQPGVATLELIPADPAYETVQARIQISPSPSSLELQLLSGGSQTATLDFLPEPILVRIGDANRLPYPGLRVSADAGPGGAVTPAVSTADEAGLVSFRWRPGPSPNNFLTLRLDAGPSLTVSALAPPFFLPGSLGSAASFAPGLTPLALHSLFGRNLSGGSTVSAPLPWPASINGVELRVNGRPQPLLYINDGQISFYLADNLGAATQATVELITPLGSSGEVPVPVVPLQPAIFPGAILRRGDFLEVYSTGLGPLTQRDGFLLTTNPVEAFINNQPVQVLFSGLAPGFLGLYQVNLRPGPLPPSPRLRLRLAGRDSNEILMP
ncbi:MAG: hypothetical protein K7J46_01935 [Bryobacter sp.]|nr:hypothetical protein [Bryobacter sp. CoA8 C33]